MNQQQEQLTVQEALEQGYTKYIYDKSDFMIVREITDLLHDDNADEWDRPLILCNKEPESPFGISSKDIAELLADHLEDNHRGEFGGDYTNAVFDAINELDFTEAENKISEALSKLHYYRATNIKLIR